MTAKRKRSGVCFSINSKTYSLEAVYGAAYSFLDKAYVFLDRNKKGDITVNLDPKQESADQNLSRLKGEFQNALINYGLRHQISRDNQKIREYIIGRALISLEADGGLPEPEKESEKIREWSGDDLGIAVPWEEKFGKTKKVKQKSRRR